MLSTSGWVNEILFPPPTTVATTLFQLISDGSLISNSLASIKRVLAGFALAGVVGIALGVALGWSRTISEVVKPVIEVIRPTPPIAWTPLAILWFGVGDGPSYFLVFIGAVFPIFINTYVAVRSIEVSQINAALCLGARPLLILTDVIVPAALPMIFPGLRIALGVGWMCVVAAELIAAQSGLGYMIQQSRMMLQTSNVLAGMVTIGVIGFAANAIMLKIEARVTRWRAHVVS